MEITYEDFERSQSEALTILVKDWKDQLFDFRAYFDLQQSATYDILYPLLNYTDLKDCERVMFHCIIKSAHIIFTTNKLVLSGDFGIARILMRESLEYLLVGKYVYYNQDFAASWLKGKDFLVKQQIWDKLRIPDSTNLKEFWGILCKLAHSKSSSVQIGNKVTTLKY